MHHGRTLGAAGMQTRWRPWQLPISRLEEYQKKKPWSLYLPWKSSRRYMSWRGEGAEDLPKTRRQGSMITEEHRIFWGSFVVQSLEIITDGLHFNKLSTWNANRPCFFHMDISRSQSPAKCALCMSRWRKNDAGQQIHHWGKGFFFFFFF